MLQNQDKVAFLVQPSAKQVKNTFAASVKALALCLSLFFATAASAQVTAVNGPSDAVSAPPASAAAVNQVVTTGGSISMKISNAPASAEVIYQWYKIDNTGTKRLVQSSTNSVYTETATDAGYYTYQLVMTNGNQCSSEISDPFKIYVLPALAPSIAASSSTICSNGTSTSTLAARAGADTRFSYTYQWMLNGTAISGATSATYTTAANASGNNTYSVKVAYALSPAISGTATQVINAIAVPTKPSISIGQ
jgi:hypothetical protein